MGTDFSIDYVIVFFNFDSFEPRESSFVDLEENFCPSTTFSQLFPTFIVGASTSDRRACGTMM